MGEVAEVTPYVDLSGWPPGRRRLVRREVPHPGAQLTFTALHGYRYQLCLTNLPDPDIAFLEALYRGRGRCEQVVRDLKATGLAHLPSADFATHQAWLTAVVPGDPGPFALHALPYGRPAHPIGTPRGRPSGCAVAVGRGPDGGRHPLSAPGGAVTAAVFRAPQGAPPASPDAVSRRALPRVHHDDRVSPRRVQMPHGPSKGPCRLSPAAPPPSSCPQRGPGRVTERFGLTAHVSARRKRPTWKPFSARPS